VSRKEEVRTKKLVEARQNLMAAEERLNMLERQQATERATLNDQLAAALNRIRHLKGVEAAWADSPDLRLQGLERKLDQLLRELKQWRRQSRPEAD
jgi:hypothetical protein